MSSAEVGTGGFNKSTLSDRSHTSLTRKNAQDKPAIGSTINGGKSSSNDCTTCKEVMLTSQPTTPFIQVNDSSAAMSIQSNH